MEFEDAFFQISDFKKLDDKKIGGGNFGDVYLVQNIYDGRIYAAKILKIDKENSGNQQKLIFRESMILHVLHHPAILKFLGINFQSISNPSNFEPTIITEYLQNGSLEENLSKERNGVKNKNWTLTKKYISLIGITDAMRYLHEQGMIHRDLKPQNVLIDDNFYPRVCDFGLARFFPDSKDLSMTLGIGTPRYMAPELFNGDPYNQSVDVYAFGMITYEVVTGKVPFSELPNINSFKLGQNVSKGYRPPFNEKVSENMKELIQRCWSGFAGKRPSFSEIFEFLISDFSLMNEKIEDEDEVRRYIERLKSERKRQKRQKKQKIIDAQKVVEYEIKEEEEEEEEYDEDSEKTAVFHDRNLVFYELNDKYKSAKIISSPDASGNVTIPAVIKFGSELYKVTEISDKAFKNSNIELLTFSSKSHMNQIGNKVFKKSKIKKIMLPKNLTKVELLWIHKANQLVEVNVDPNNSYFTSKNGLLTFFNEAQKEIIFVSREFKGDFSVPEGTTRIGNFSFAYVQGIVSLESTAPTLKEIGSYSFYNCRNLKSVNISQDEELTLFKFCFLNCINLLTVDISCESFKSFKKCFYQCELLTSLKITSSGEINLHSETFKGCYNLKEIVFQKSSELVIENDDFYWPDNLQSISFIEVKKVALISRTFSNLKRLENISIIKSVKLNFRDECFSCLPELRKIKLISESINFGNDFASRCSYLSDVNIQSKNDIIFPQSSFKQSKSIQNVLLKTQSKLKIPNDFLSEFTKLKNVVLSGQYVRICDSCFQNCSSLENIEIVESGTVKFGNDEFLNCTNLYQISIDLKSQIYFGTNCFNGCNNLHLYQHKGGNVIIDNDCFKYNLPLTDLVFLKTNQITIPDDQFSESKTLEHVTLNSESDIKLGDRCFYRSEKLDIIQLVSKDISVNPDAFGGCYRPLEATFKASSSLSLFEKSFIGSNLIKIELNGKDVIIHDECFYNCQSLKKLIFGVVDNLTLCSSLFNMCNKLEIITIEVSKLLKIQSNCFLGSNVKEVIIRARDVEIESNAFKNSLTINKVDIDAMGIKLEDNVFEGCLNLQNIKFESTYNLIIGDYCFVGTKDLNSLSLRGNSISIGKASFCNCNKLCKFCIQNSDQVILGESVFANCNNIKHILIEVQTRFRAGIKCFSSLSKLNTFQISGKNVLLENLCFEKCYNLETFSILETEDTKFYEKAFYECSRLKSVDIKGNQIFFGSFCFSRCSALSHIKCTSNQITYSENSFNGKSHEDFIKCTSKTNFKIETKKDDNKKGQSTLRNILNKLIK